MLSRTNKLGTEDRAAYLAKRRQMLRSEANFVEIDLLRAGEPMPLAEAVDADYRVIVSRVEDRPRVEEWPLRLRDRLPVIPIPLRRPDPDVTLDLQALLNASYDAAGYEDYVYRDEPNPRLHREDAKWAQALIAPAGQ